MSQVIDERLIDAVSAFRDKLLELPGVVTVNYGLPQQSLNHTTAEQCAVFIRFSDGLYNAKYLGPYYEGQYGGQVHFYWLLTSTNGEQVEQSVMRMMLRIPMYFKVDTNNGEDLTEKATLYVRSTAFGQRAMSITRHDIAGTAHRLVMHPFDIHIDLQE